MKNQNTWYTTRQHIHRLPTPFPAYWYWPNQLCIRSHRIQRHKINHHQKHRHLFSINTDHMVRFKVLSQNITFHHIAFKSPQKHIPRPSPNQIPSTNIQHRNYNHLFTAHCKWQAPYWYHGMSNIQTQQSKTHKNIVRTDHGNRGWFISHCTSSIR